MSTLAQKVLSTLQNREQSKAQQTRVEQPIDAVDAVASPEALEPESPPAELCTSAFHPEIARVEDISASNETDTCTQPTIEPPPSDELGEPCPDCGGVERWRWVDGRLICRSCVIKRDAPPMAVKVQSEVLDAAVWMVADDLPRCEWPIDAPVYTQTEVRILRQVGPNTLAWVHATKAIFGARVLQSRRKPERKAP